MITHSLHFEGHMIYIGNCSTNYKYCSDKEKGNIETTEILA